MSFRDEIAPDPNTRASVIIPTEALLRTTHFFVEPPISLFSDTLGWAYEVRIALPRSYSEGDRSYPALWLTDNNLEPALSVLDGEDIVLISVGAGRVPLAEASRRRLYDLKPGENYFFDGPGGEHLRRVLAPRRPEMLTARGGGAALFLDFLNDVVRPLVARKYRLDAAEQALFGFSAGGAFVCNALLTQPESFSSYICGSAPLYSGDCKVFELEKLYAAEHDDLRARVFFGVGEGEMTEELYDALGCVSSTARLVETLSFRRYPSLQLTAKVFAGETHRTMLHPLMNWGVRAIWGERMSGGAR